MSHIAERLTDLLRPDAFAHPAREPRLLETHISWVILAGDFAYKIRKQVNFGFLDFSTLEQRRADCDAEVHLNRRLCPDLYLDVVDVLERDAHLSFGGTGTPVEPAVRLRRLPDSGMLPALFERGVADERLLGRIARKLAEFHIVAASGPGVDEYGSTATIRANWEENFAQATSVESNLRDGIHAYVDDFLTMNADLLERRIRRGRIRDGHGDLHAGSVCATRRRQYLFDCIEFNARFRCADVAADVAFLAMDLDHLGRADLSGAFVDAYVRASGDRELVPLLDLASDSWNRTCDWWSRLRGAIVAMNSACWTRILVPLDGSGLAEGALTYATAIADKTGATVTLLRVSSSNARPPDFDPDGRAPRAVDEARKYIEQMVVWLGEDGTRCESVVRFGHPFERILDLARTRPADLIVMATHGRTGPEHLVFGSVAEAVVARSPVPVLVPRAWQPRFGDPRLEGRPKLLVPLDGSPFAEAVLEPAALLAKDLDGQLALIRVEDKPGAIRVASDYLEGVQADSRRHIPACQLPARSAMGMQRTASNWPSDSSKSHWSLWRHTAAPGSFAPYSAAWPAR